MDKKAKKVQANDLKHKIPIQKLAKRDKSNQRETPKAKTKANEASQSKFRETKAYPKANKAKGRQENTP
jgi:hypothetical protein